jgi:ADP-heptose:LPS heptosyltransferase
MDGIGDALVCVPLIAALRAAGHEVGALLSTRNRDALSFRAFDRVHVVERVPWPRHGLTPATRAEALAAVRNARYDAALIVSEEPDAYLMPREAGIAARTGFINGLEKPLKTLRYGPSLTRAITRSASREGVREHEVETIFRLGAGFVAESAAPRDPARLRPLVLDTEPPRHGRVVVQLASKFAAAGLDAAAFAALTRALAATGEEPLCLCEDARFAADVVARGGCASTTPPTLAQWKDALAGARVVITPDSGAAHVAGMLGVPCVSLFPPERGAAHDLVRWRPWTGHARTLVAVELAVPYGAHAAEFAERVASEAALLAAQAVPA